MYRQKQIYYLMPSESLGFVLTKGFTRGVSEFGFQNWFVNRYQVVLSYYL